MAAILSANGEKYPLTTWDINMKTFFNILEVSRLNNVEKVFFPSSIAVFGDNIDRIDTAQSSNLTPSTVYGFSKVAGENWSKYYFEKYGLDGLLKIKKGDIAKRLKLYEKMIQF